MRHNQWVVRKKDKTIWIPKFENGDSLRDNIKAIIEGRFRWNFIGIEPLEKRWWHLCEHYKPSEAEWSPSDPREFDVEKVSPFVVK
jgi:hypothetical protein